jgi:hypothetical protein
MVDRNYEMIIKITRLCDSFDTFYKRYKKYHYHIYLDNLSDKYDEDYLFYIQHNHFYFRPDSYMRIALRLNDKLRNLIIKQGLRCTKWI